MVWCEGKEMIYGSYLSTEGYKVANDWQSDLVTVCKYLFMMIYLLLCVSKIIRNKSRSNSVPKMSIAMNNTFIYTTELFSWSKSHIVPINRYFLTNFSSKQVNYFPSHKDHLKFEIKNIIFNCHQIPFNLLYIQFIILAF